jgi:hypothetical protein
MNGAKSCMCDGRYDGCEHDRRCGQHVSDDRWGPWCSDCNPRRFAHIDRNLAAITSALDQP